MINHDCLDTGQVRLDYLDQAAAESPLVNMSVTSCLTMGMVTLSVSQCDPADKRPHTAIGLW